MSVSGLSVGYQKLTKFRIFRDMLTNEHQNPLFKIFMK